jgi:hypothetical protein
MSARLVLVMGILVTACQQDSVPPTAPVEPIQIGADAHWPGSAPALPQAAANVLTVKQDKLVYSAGEIVGFSGRLKTSSGKPVVGVQVGVDDPLTLMCTLAPRTDANGNFRYQSRASAGAKGVYAFTFYGGGSPTFAAVAVNSTSGLQLTNVSHKIPLGVTSAPASLDLGISAKLTSGSGLPAASQSQLRTDLNNVTNFMANAGRNAIVNFVSNPANDIVVLGAAGCAVGIWTGVGTIPCTALYTYIVVSGAKSAATGVIGAAIDASNLTAAEKTTWKKATNCVAGMVMLDPASATASFSTVATGWSCGSALASVTKDSQGRSTLRVVATPPAAARNQTAVGIVLIQK